MHLLQFCYGCLFQTVTTQPPVAVSTRPGAVGNFSIPILSSQDFNLECWKMCFEAFNLWKKQRGSCSDTRACQSIKWTSGLFQQYVALRPCGVTVCQVQYILWPTQNYNLLESARNETKTGSKSCRDVSVQTTCVIFDGCNSVSFGVSCGFKSCWHTYAGHDTFKY